jgi:hypothetical protein
MSCPTCSHMTKNIYNLEGHHRWLGMMNRNKHIILEKLKLKERMH